MPVSAFPTHTVCKRSVMTCVGQCHPHPKSVRAAVCATLTPTHCVPVPAGRSLPPPPALTSYVMRFSFCALRGRSRGGHVPGKTPHWRVIVMAFPMQGRCLQSHS